MINPLEEKFTFVKEIKYNFANVPTIFGKIYKVDSSPVEGFEYWWNINYFNQLATEATVYKPGTATRYSHSESDAEKKLEDYVMRFEDAVNWLINSDF